MSQIQFQKFLKHENFTRVHFYKQPEIEINSITLEQAQKFAQTLVARMSPENLTCDGELSRSQVNARIVEIRGAAAYLMSRFPDLAQPEWDDCDLFARPSVTSPTVLFQAGQKVSVNSPRLGGRAVGTILKINRTRARVEFPGAGTYSVPFGLLNVA